MSESADPKRKTRRTRRNYAQELQDLRQYIVVSIEVLQESETLSDFTKGEIAVLEKLAKRIGGVNGR